MHAMYDLWWVQTQIIKAVTELEYLQIPARNKNSKSSSLVIFNLRLFLKMDKDHPDQSCKATDTEIQQTAKGFWSAWAVIQKQLKGTVLSWLRVTASWNRPGKRIILGLHSLIRVSGLDRLKKALLGTKEWVNSKENSMDLQNGCFWTKSGLFPGLQAGWQQPGEDRPLLTTKLMAVCNRRCQ